MLNARKSGFEVSNSCFILYKIQNIRNNGLILHQSIFQISFVVCKQLNGLHDKNYDLDAQKLQKYVKC